MRRNTIVGIASCLLALGAPVALVFAHSVYIGACFSVLALLVNAFAE